MDKDKSMEKQKFYPYAVIRKEDIREHIKEQIINIQKENGIVCPEEYKDDIEIRNNNDLSADCFLDNLEFMQTAYIKENGRNKLLPEVRLDDGTALSLKRLQDCINSLSFKVSYLGREGQCGKSSEYGNYYVTEPVYVTDILSPDIDIYEMFEDLQRFADLHPETFLEYRETEKINEPDLEF